MKRRAGAAASGTAMTGPEQEEKLREGIARLTEQRDLAALDAVLCQLLVALLPQPQIALYEFECGEYPCPELAGAAPEAVRLLDLQRGGEALNLAAHPHLMQAAESRAPALSQDGERCELVYPLAGFVGLRGLLLVTLPTCSGPARETADFAMRVHQNLSRLISRSERDSLTRLLNRKAFDDRVDKLMHRQRRRDDLNGGDSSFALLDIDHFKRVNDRFGHLYGDEVLVWFARLLADSFRHGDLLFRYGGEEFAVVLSSMAPGAAKEVLERFRRRVAETKFPLAGHITVSVGLARMPVAEPITAVISRADTALYYAKRHGRNRVACFEELQAAGRLREGQAVRGDIELFP